MYLVFCSYCSCFLSRVHVFSGPVQSMFPTTARFYTVRANMPYIMWIKTIFKILSNITLYNVLAKFGDVWVKFDWDTSIQNVEHLPRNVWCPHKSSGFLTFDFFRHLNACINTKLRCFIMVGVITRNTDSSGDWQNVGETSPRHSRYEIRQYW